DLQFRRLLLALFDARDAQAVAFIGVGGTHLGPGAGAVQAVHLRFVRAVAGRAGGREAAREAQRELAAFLDFLEARVARRRPSVSNDFDRLFAAQEARLADAIQSDVRKRAAASQRS